ncbi:putative multidrug export ATP-binding/permease protein [Thalassoglobus neptunius]|uniref:Putative multidrug export ATP-binding/permease protein n=1 Tax=Thalassoglobus neptunius TaxID=1938619 RepID=A0A5C5WH43_9PLAN|nr:ABC transporter ATP-binding protein [Thalassoglobus neptunius]TWT50106.1 putative multidrug export ATP-binding/permease protein [Thalassoglobus neptunius]
MELESPKQPPSSLWALTQGNRLLYSAAIAVMALGMLFLLLVPFVLQQTLDRLRDGSATPTGTLVPAAAFLVTLNLLHGGFTYLRGRWSAQASEAVVQRLRRRLYAHIEALPARYYDTNSTGDIVQRCSSDVETVRAFMANHIVEIAKVALLLLIGLPILFSQDLKMGWISISLFPFIIGFGFYYFRRIHEIYQKVDEAEGALTTVLQENLTGVRVVRAFGQQEAEIEKFRGANAKFRDLEMDMFRTLSSYWPISDFLIFLQLGTVLVSGAYFAMTGAITVGTWIFFWWLTQTIIWPVRQIGRVVADAGRATVAMKRINEILGEPEESSEPEPEEPVSGEIVVRDLSFSYVAGEQVLNDISFSIAPGETVAIVGPPGAGKSTLMHLLVRLYDYSEGSITIGGTELNEINRHAVRSAFGVVMQDPFLYSRSVRDNMIIGKSHASEQDIKESALAADIHGNISDFKNGYQTIIGERGVTLSGGQRQRLAIARALLKHPTFLILDDSLSAVDTRTETQILKSLHARRGQQTTILIAHRLSTTRLADRIFVMDHGRIIQEGTHSELIEVDGPYQRLWTIQGVVEEEIQEALAEGSAQ